MARNGDGLFRRGALWYFKYRDQSGQYHEKSTGQRKQPDARESKHEFLEKLRQNQLPTEERKWKLEQALEKYLEFRTQTRPKASTAAEQTAARHLADIIGSKRRLDSITIWDIRRFQIRRSESVGPKTINNELLVLTALLKTARLWGPLKEDYELLPVRKGGPGQALTPDQTAKLIEIAKVNESWFVALCATVLAYATGCRAGEIRTWQLGGLLLGGPVPCIRLRGQVTKGRRQREPALNDLAMWATK